VGRFVRQNSLSLFFLLIFLGTLVGQSIAGHNNYNEDQLAHHGSPIAYTRYLTSSEFGREVMENWQSEFLQFTLYLMATIWLVQKGSPESKPEKDRGLQTEEDQLLGPHAKESSPRWARVGGLRRAIYSNSFLILMATIFIGTVFAQSVTGWSEYNSNAIQHHQPETTWGGYLGSSDFWDDMLQNWQSEFLAIGSFAAFGVYLRQRGSPESKPVGAPHEETGVTS
jgi:hypothetical protein